MSPAARPFPESLQTKWYRGLSGMDELRRDWQSLDTTPSLLTSYAWHRATAQHLIADPTELWLCRIANAANQPLAIIPVHATRMAIGEFGFRNTLSLDWNAHFPLFDFPVAVGADPEVVAQALAAAFRTHPYPWQVIYWGRVLATSNAARIASAMPTARTLIEDAEPCHILDVHQEQDETGLPRPYTFASKNLKALLTQGRNRLAKLGPLQIRKSPPTQDTEAFLAEFLRVEGAGWKGDAGTAASFSPPFVALMRALVASADPAIQAEMVLLYCGEDAVAAQFCITAGRTVFTSKQGYDERFARMHPGHVLTSMLLAEGKLNDHLDVVNFISGMAWRQPYRPLELPTLDIVLFRSRPQRDWTLLRRAASRAKRKLLNKD